MSAPLHNGVLVDARRRLANISADQPCRTPDAACIVCTAPVECFQRCYRCNEHLGSGHADALADLVVPLAYAWEGQSQLGKDVYSYKRDQGRRAANAIGNLAALLYSFAAVHAACPGRHLGMPVTAKAAIPSLRGNPSTILAQMAERLLPSGWPLIPVAATGSYGDDGRSLDPAHFRVDPRGPVRGAHVLVLEDTWVTGGHSQAITVAIKRAGATAVTVLPICRLLRLAWPPNLAYRDSSHRRPWSSEICPVTGFGCP